MGIDVLPLVKAGLALLAAGGVVIAALSLLPRTASRARSVWPIYLTEVAIVGTVFAAFAAGGFGPAILALLITVRVAYEAAVVALARLASGEAGAGNHAPSTLPFALAAATGLVAFAGTLLPLRMAAGAAVAIALVALIILWLRRGEQRTLPNALVEMLLFPLLPAVVFTAASARLEFAGLLLVLFILVETNDSYALLGGKVFGRRQAFPKLSPKKTVEGLAIGALALAATTALVGTRFFGFSLAACVGIAIAVGILSIAGDLAASRLKRVAGVKDYPLFMPRQGGLLDIVDAWLMTGAVVSAAIVLMGLA